MRLLLSSHHRYPAEGCPGSGLEPKEFPSGSGSLIHDLLVKGLTALGHEVRYLLPKGASHPLPQGATLVTGAVTDRDDIDLYHSVYLAGRHDPVAEYLHARGTPWVTTCHLAPMAHVSVTQPMRSQMIFVSRSLALAHHSDRFVWNGLDPDQYRYSQTKGDYFLFVSALDRALDKGLDIALAVTKRRGVRLVVAGTGRSRGIIDEVTAMCRSAGAECVGDLRGREKADIYAGARGLLHPSKLNEGCPLAIIEALMSGTPVIASGSGGSADMVSPDVGFICDSEEDYLWAVDHVGDISPPQCARVAREKYHYLRMTKDYLKEYERELEGFR